MTNIRFKAFLLDYAIKHRIDLLELMRNNTREEYNRGNPLYPLSKLGWSIMKGQVKSQMG